MMRRFLIAVPGLLVLLFAGSTAALAGQQSAIVDPFDLGTGAGPSAMGATVAAPGNMWSLSFNPAGLTDVKATQIGFSHLRWTVDQSASYAGAAFANGAALGVAYFDESTINEVSQYSATGEQIRASDVGIMGGFGFRLPMMPDVSIGLSAEAVQMNLGPDYRATWAAANLGAQWAVMPGVATVGAQLENVGSSVHFTSTGADQPQPTALSGGVSLRIPPGLLPQSSIILGADVRKERFRDVQFRTGGEIRFAGVLAVRAGYLGGEDEGKFTAGAGFKYSTFELDYAFRDMSALGTTHRISLSMGLGQ